MKCMDGVLRGCEARPPIVRSQRVRRRRGRERGDGDGDVDGSGRVRDCWSRIGRICEPMGGKGRLRLMDFV